MRIEHPHHRRAAFIRNAEHPDAAIVVRDVFEKPFNRIPGVGTLVYRFRIA